MKLFKDASKQEHQNWNKAVSVGFYILFFTPAVCEYIDVCL
ncbi:MAG: hypothetical protein PME_09880 [Priestia megaterium]